MSDKNVQLNIHAPKTMGELRNCLSQIMAGAINGTVPLDNGRLALNAATRIIESIQAETRARALQLNILKVETTDRALIEDVGSMSIIGQGV